MTQGSALLFLGHIGQRSRSQSAFVQFSFPDSNSRTKWPTSMKLYANVAYDPRKCPIVFGSYRSKVKVTVDFCSIFISGLLTQKPSDLESWNFMQMLHMTSILVTNTSCTNSTCILTKPLWGVLVCSATVSSFIYLNISLICIMNQNFVESVFLACSYLNYLEWHNMFITKVTHLHLFSLYVTLDIT